jgi:uncharacterized protein
MPPFETPLSRRAFIKAGAAAAGVIAGCDSSPQAPPAGPLPPPGSFPRRLLKRRDISMPILQMGGDYTYTPRLLDRCLKLGVRSFDTAENYAQRKSEALIGQCLARLKVQRDTILLATKAYAKYPRDILSKHLPDSLRRLQTDYVDLWYLHDLDRPEVLSSHEWKAAAAELIKSGKARAFGLTCHNENAIAVMNAAARCGWVDVIMFRYNFRSRGNRSLDETLDACHQAGIALIAMKTQASSVSFSERVDPFKKAGYNKNQAVLKAVWQDPRITAIVSAMPTESMVEQNAAAAYDRLSLAEADLLNRYAIATANTYCPAGCGGCRRECEEAIETPLPVADILRFLMYHDSYGRRLDARRLFGELPPHLRSLEGADLHAAAAACPNRLALDHLLPAAFDKLS